MRALAILAALVLVAGCVEDDPSGTPPVKPVANASEGGSAEEFVPLDETALADRPHLHDYWEGRDRVTLFDGEVEPEAQPALENTLVATFFNREPGKIGGTFFLLPEGAIVFEGTGAMEVTVTATDPRVTGVAMRVRSAAGPEWSDDVPLPSGAAVAIEVTPAMTDMPHMSTSRWAFWFGADAAPGAVMGPFRVTIDLVRMRDVTMFPAHPQLFEGKPEKLLLDEERRSAQVSYARRVPNLATEGQFGEHEFPPAALVPMETKAIRVEVDVSSASASAGEVTEIRFFYRGADTYELARVMPTEGSMETGRWVFEIAEVAMEQVDSPYGEGSQWRFMVEAATSLAGEEQTCGGCVDTDIQFRVRVTAFDHALDAEASEVA